MTDGLTASDVALLQNGNGNGFGWGNDGAWWIILFLIFGWGNNGGYGFGGGAGASQNYVLASDFATIQRQLSDGFNSIDNALDAQNTGICNLGYTQLQLNNQLSAQIADCCCKTQTNIGDVKYAIGATGADLGRQIERGFAETNYNMATQNCATLQAIDKVGDRVIDYLSNEKMQNLRDENFALRLSASQQAQNAYLVDQLGYHCPVSAYVVQPPQSVTFPVGCNGVASYANNGCGCAIN